MSKGNRPLMEMLSKLGKWKAEHVAFCSRVDGATKQFIAWFWARKDAEELEEDEKPL